LDLTRTDDLFFVDLTEMKDLFSLKGMLLFIILALLTDNSHVHFKFSEESLNDIKVSETDVIDYLCDNSYFIRNTEKKECHFIFSVAAILAFDYTKQDKIKSTLMRIQQNVMKDFSLSSYIHHRKSGQNINNKSEFKSQSRNIKIKI
jgi:hypothetical protein